ncbi:MAG: hypothetical protein IJA10_04990 [Lachnospiraceae bacterium]|nr:hypothetical protein [Lachnospiraceae bacterium]
MEERKTIFDYLGQIFMIFGITIAVLNVLCVLFGEDAKSVSAMFSLGNQGLSVPIVFQFLGVSVVIVTLRFLFFTDVIIKNMSVTARMIWMIVLVLLTISAFIIIFKWFPADMWQPWAMFFLCFGVSFGISMVLTIVKEKAETRKMEEALERLKHENER